MNWFLFVRFYADAYPICKKNPIQPWHRQLLWQAGLTKGTKKRIKKLKHVSLSVLNPRKEGCEWRKKMFSNRTALSSTLSSSLPLLKVTKISLPESFDATSCSPFALPSVNPKLRRRKRVTLSKSSENPSSITAASPSATDVDEDSSVDSAPDVVRGFYGGINAHDLYSVNDLIAEKCVYEDLVFARPFVGRMVNYNISLSIVGKL